MKVTKHPIILLTALFLFVSPSYSQTVQTLGADPLTAEQYACVAFNPTSKNNISVTNKKGKSKTFKIADAKKKVSDHKADAKLKLKEVVKARRDKEKQRNKIEGSLFGPAQVAKYNKLNEELKKLDLRIAKLASDIASLTQLINLIADCRDATPVFGKIQFHSGIIPPKTPGGSETYYAFIILVFSPNTATQYCATFEFEGGAPKRSSFNPSGTVCVNYGLPECFDPRTDAGGMIRNWMGTNRPGKCSAPEVCDLQTAIAAASAYMGTLKIYDIKPSATGRCDP